MRYGNIFKIAGIFLFVAGGLSVFAAQEVGYLMHNELSSQTIVFAQLAGFGMIAIGIQDWMLRNQPTGGIYARPLAIANLLFFSSSALTLGRHISTGNLALESTILCIVFTLLTLAFVRVIFFQQAAVE